MKKIAVITFLFLFPFASYADIIHFKDGKKIEVEGAWEEGGQVKCKRFGGVVSYPKSKVDRIEKDAAAPEEKEPNQPDPGSAGGDEDYAAATLAEEAFHLMASNAFSEHVQRAANEKLEMARQIDPEEPWIFLCQSYMTLQEGYRIGKWYKARSFAPGTADKAMPFARKAVSLDPNFSKGYSHLGWLHIIKGDYRNANRFLDTAYNLDDASFQVWLYKGTLALEMRNVDAAREMFEEAQRYAAHPYQKSVIRGRKRDVARLTGDTREEESLLLEAIEEDPYSAYPYGNYANFLMNQGRYNEAVEFYEKAIRIKPYPAAIRALEEARKKAR